jgi:hypothetical protein
MQTLVLCILGYRPGFGGLVRIALLKTKLVAKKRKKERNEIHPHHTLYPISYQGGAIIGVFMIQALKGAFMGYIGLLLNAPYKIDSMVWMMMRILTCFLLLCLYTFLI